MNQKEKIQIIVNCGAGTGQGHEVWKRTRRWLARHKIPYQAYRTKYEKHAARLAWELSHQDGDDLVFLLVVGGDGTINEVLNGVADFERVHLGVISTGSGNDFARNLGIPKEPEAALAQIFGNIRRIEDGEPARRMDLGKVEWEGCTRPRLFGISAGLGLDALVCKKALHSRLKQLLNRFHLGKLTYLLLTVESLFAMETSDVRFATEREVGMLPKMIFAAAMNLPAEGGGVPMAPEANPADGRLSLASASGIAKWHTFFLLPLLVAAKQDGIRGFDIRDAERIILDSEKPMTLHADGEYCGEVRHVKFQCLKGKLKLLHGE